jgi:CRISPR-associated protein Cmr6
MIPMPEIRVAGPIGRAVTVDGGTLSVGDANARLVLDRVSGYGDANRRTVDAAKRRWLAHRLTNGHAPLRRALLRRRRAAMAKLDDQEDLAVVEVKLKVAGAPLAIGHSGAGGANDNSLTLHRISGDPVLPATALKGVTGALSPDDDRLVGRAPNATIADPGAMGAVTFLAGLASGEFSVGQAILTPHARSYYQDPANPPSGQDPPVPIEFLVVRSGSFVAHLIGSDTDEVLRAAGLLIHAADDIGLGAKTSAGFGYLTATAAPLTGPATP